MSLAEEVAAVLPQGLVTGYMGVVKSIDSTGKPTVDVRGALLAASVNASYSPAVGDNVMLMRNDNANSWVVAFKVVAGSANPWVSGTLGAGNGGSIKCRWLNPTKDKVEYAIALNPLATKAGGATLGTVPAGFRPSATADGLNISCNATVAGGQVPHFYVDSAGAVVGWGLDNANVAFATGFYPLNP